MIIILDTSAAVEIVLNRSRQARLQAKVTEADWVVSPNLYIAEITNVFWKYYQHSDLPLATCEQAIESAVALPDDYMSESQLYQEAFALACLAKMPVYDMYFLVLARRYNGTLLTLDQSLAKRARKHSIMVFSG